jgi:hypothetical protein
MSKLVEQVLSQRATDSWVEEWLALTLDVLSRHRRDFDLIVDRMPLAGNVKTHYAAIVSQMFDDGRTNWGRVVTVLAFATYLQTRYDIDLKSETSTLLEENVFGWLRRQDCEETYDFVDNFSLLEWLPYSVTVLLHNVVTWLIR